MTFAVLMPVGPGATEVERARDTLESVRFWEPDTTIVIVDDDPGGRDLAAVRELGRVHVVPNPREGRGDGLWGGLAAGVLAGYAMIQRDLDVEFVVKLDTDALVVGTFADAVRKALDEPGVGMAGTAHRHCDGSPRSFERWVTTLRRWRFPVRTASSPTGRRRFDVVDVVRGSQSVVRRRMRTARRSGYVLGEHCLGGAYAVSRLFLDRMTDRGWWDDWPAWVPTPFGEDVCVGLYVRAVGLDVVDANRPGQPFGVEHKALPGSTATIDAAGWSILHSIKDQPVGTEAELRAHYAALRGPAPAGGGLM